MVLIAAEHALTIPSTTTIAVEILLHNRTMVRLTPLVIILPLLAFWVWVFRDMARNDSLPGIAKQYW